MQASQAANQGKEGQNENVHTHTCTTKIHSFDPIP